MTKNDLWNLRQNDRFSKNNENEIFSISKFSITTIFSITFAIEFFNKQWSTKNFKKITISIVQTLIFEINKKQLSKKFDNIFIISQNEKLQLFRIKYFKNNKKNSNELSIFRKKNYRFFLITKMKFQISLNQQKKI